MRKTISYLLLVATYVGAVGQAAVPVRGQVIGRAMEQKMADLPDGLKFRLSEGVEGAEKRVKETLPSTDPLAPGATAQLLKRVPEVKTDAGDETDFAKRVGTLPAPKTGTMVPVKFPSDEQRNPLNVDMSGKTLQVLRYSPEGEVPLAPDLNVTFSQPMVAVSTQEQAAQFTPVELNPQVDGRWRWLGAKTLMFDTTKRFPMATKFTARVPAGTKSATGQTLDKDVTWTFTTPPPKVENSYPSGNVTTSRDTMVFLSFDQAINADAVLGKLNVTGAGKRLNVRLASDAEIAQDLSISSLVKAAQPGRWLVFRAVDQNGGTVNALPGGTYMSVTVPVGTPSAEGPLTTIKDQGFGFQTYGDMRLVGNNCGVQNKPLCSPADEWYLQFTNAVEATKFSKEMIHVEPPLDGLNIYPSGNYVLIAGYKKGRTTYKVTVDGSLPDAFGQTMGQAATTTIKVGSAQQQLYAQGGFMTVMDPSAKPTFSIYSTNLASVKVKVYRVRPQDWAQYIDFVRHLNYDDGKRPPMPGRLVVDRTEDIATKPDELVETRIDIADALDGGYGNAVIDVEPTVRRDKYDRTRVLTWAQATQIGLDAFVDNTDLVGFATELKTGRPMAGVDLSIYPNGKGIVGTQVVNDQKGVVSEVWDWVASFWGPSAGTGDIQAADENGDTAAIETIETAQTNRTGDNGILRLPLPEGSSTTPNLLIARRGKDVAFVPDNGEYFWQDSGTWYKKPDVDSLRWFVFDDRSMYKPKEEVAVKGYIRKMTAGKFSDIEAVGDSASGLSFSVKDSRNNEIAKGTANLNSFGAFDFKFTIPDNANLGYSRIDLSTGSSLPGSQTSHTFQVQEFRRPEFEVTTKVASEAPFFIGGNALVSTEAKYYAGGGLANADTNWTVTATPTNYTPPNRGDYTFGTWMPWWGGYYFDEMRSRVADGVSSQTFKGVTDASGKHVLKIDFDSVKPPRPYTITASAAVQDVNRQTWAGSTTMLVHPASLYVGIKTPRTFVQKGEKIDVESIVSDIDGNLVGGRDVEIKAVLKDWAFENGKWGEKVLDEQNCSVKSADKGQNCSFIARQGGSYTVTATVMDDHERFNQSELTVWVPGGKTPPKRSVEQEQVQIIPSKKDYAPGDVAELLVISPFTPAEGVLTLRRDGIVKTERFSMKDSSTTLKIPLEERYLPNITAQVDLVGVADRTNDKGEIDPKLGKRPAYASGNIDLQISAASRKLTVAANPAETSLAPGGETKIGVDVKDFRGEPVADSEVAVVVVDESVLALSRYTIGDPADAFYTSHGAGVMDYHLRKDVLLGNPGDVKVSPPEPPATAVDADTISTRKVAELPINGQRGAPLAGIAAGVLASPKSEARNEFKAKDDSVNGAVQQESPDTGIALRENFNALALWSPTVRTDGTGHAVVDLKLPDNLTRYRITAVSVDSGKRFGKAESTITAKQPLMVRPSAPRFMNFGDKVDLPVVIQNQTDKDMSVDVAIRASNALVEGGSSADGALSSGGKRVFVKANDRAEIRFPVSTVKAGTARFQFAVSSGAYSDAAEVSLPVWTPATTEAFATYGTTDQNGTIVQPIQTPGDVFPQFGGLEVTTSSTQLQELTDAFLYLTNYPYACSEQISSRMISIAAMRDVLNAFKAKEMPTPKELDSYFARDIEILKSRQRDDGSFGLWKRDRERYEYPFLTVHVAHALALSKAKGYKVPDEMINRTKPYLKDIEKHFETYYPPEVRWTISAYALYVRDMMGDKDTAKAKRLLAEATVDKMPFEALGWVLDVLANDPGSAAEVQAIERHLMNSTTETAATANFVTDYGDGAWLIMYSNRRADGVLLEALIKADPTNDLIPKLVRGLLDHRTKGAWSNTQENVFILLALDKYFNTYEKVTPDFVSRVWLGNTYAGEQTFKGRSADSNVLNIPMSYLTDQGGMSNLIIDREGAGRLYYRIGMTYAPKNLKLDPADYGFTVLRQYEAVDDKDDVKQNADGSWTIKSGARVRVRLTMVAQARRYHVALVDELPAGLEILNPELATTEVIPADATPPTGMMTYDSRSFGGYWWWQQNWFEHQNFRDERAEAFTSLLWEGVYNYSYVARATTPGQFVVPPSKAEEMYHPETFGRTATDFVRVE